MKKNGKKNSQKHPLLTAAKVVTIVLAAWFSCAMPVLSGAGLIYNRGSYGAELTRVGVFLIAAGVVMSLGAVLCLFRKNLANVAAVILSCGGFALCMTMLHKLALHADKRHHGSDKRYVSFEAYPEHYPDRACDICGSGSASFA